VLYKHSNNNALSVYFENGDIENMDSLAINKSISEKIFNRSGEIEKIEVHIKKN